MTGDTERNQRPKFGYIGIVLKLFRRIFASPVKSITLGENNYHVDQSIYDKLVEELSTRYTVAKESQIFLSEAGLNINDHADTVSLKTRLSITDVFAEKAIIRLTRRAYWYSMYGVFMLVSFFALLGFAFNHLVNDYYSNLIYNFYPAHGAPRKIQVHVLWDGYTFALELSRHLAIGAIFAAGLYMTAALAKSFIEEAAKLFNRRHAVRAGRLAIWLTNGNISAEDIARFFNVSAGESSSFGSIDTSISAKTPAGVIGDLIPKIIEAIESKKAAK